MRPTAMTPTRAAVGDESLGRIVPAAPTTAHGAAHAAVHHARAATSATAGPSDAPASAAAPTAAGVARVVFKRSVLVAPTRVAPTTLPTQSSLRLLDVLASSCLLTCCCHLLLYSSRLGILTAVASDGGHHANLLGGIVVSVLLKESIDTFRCSRHTPRSERHYDGRRSQSSTARFFGVVRECVEPTHPPTPASIAIRAYFIEQKENMIERA